MDPDEVLAQLRELTEEHHESDTIDPAETKPSVLLAEAGRIIVAMDSITDAFAALDSWITGGGFLPAEWQPARERGRPKKEAGIEVPGVEHGTRKGYSAGCRCLPCREANAKAAREWRNKKRAEETE